MDKAFSFSVDSSGIGRLLFDRPGEKHNSLSPEVLEELSAILEELEKKKELRALVLTSGKEDSFIAGADLRSFDRVMEDPKLGERFIKEGHRLFSKLSRLPFPTLAAIHGVCLGGGLELALACNYRVVTDDPKSKLGLPEVTLGIFPGWGGTQRLPRLIGLQQALKMILSGKPVEAARAWKMRLADRLITRAFFEEQIGSFLDELLEGKVKRRRKGLSDRLLEDNPLGRKLLFRKARKSLLEKTKGHYEAPFMALELLERSYPLSLEEGLEEEKSLFIEKLREDFRQAKELIWLYFQQERLKKESLEKAPRQVEQTAVIGAGTMGEGIAWCISHSGFAVRIKDVNWQAIGGCYAGIAKNYEQKKSLSAREKNLALHRISASIDYRGFSSADLVIEAASENAEVKRKIFKELEEVVSESCLIGTNSSSLPVSELAGSMRHPERVVAMHFFNPANRMPLVEIAAGPKTSQEALSTAFAFCKEIGKMPLLVKECPGLLVNRLFAAGFLSLLRLLEEGAVMREVEEAVVDFGWPMAPFVLADRVGNDISFHAFKNLERAYGSRMRVPALLERLVEKKWYGVKTGRGFYLYEGGKRRENPELGLSRDKSFSKEEIRKRMLFPMVDEAARCLEEGVVKRAADVDLALIMGAGFPPFRGGLLRWADRQGIGSLVSWLELRGEPAPLLKELERGFY